MKKIIVLVVVIILFNVAGCSQKKMENSTYPMAIGIDKGKDDLDITFGFPILEEKADNGTDNKAVRTKSIIGAKDIYDAIRNYERNTDKSIDCGHVKVLVIGKDMMEEVKNDLWEDILKSGILARNVLIFEADNAKDIIECETDTSVGEYLEGVIESDVYAANTCVTLGNMFEQQHGGRKNVMIPYLKLNDKIPYICSYSVLRNMRTVDIIDSKEQLMALLLDGRLKKYSFYTADDTLVRLSDIKVKRNIQNKSGKAFEKFDISATAQIFSELYFNKAASELKKINERTQVQLRDELNEELDREEDVGVDLTGSFSKVGAFDRELWKKYINAQEKYEKDKRSICSVKLYLNE